MDIFMDCGECLRSHLFESSLKTSLESDIMDVSAGDKTKNQSDSRCGNYFNYIVVIKCKKYKDTVLRTVPPIGRACSVVLLNLAILGHLHATSQILQSLDKHG